MIRNYFKIAVRNFRRQKVYTFINLTGLAVGLACVIFILFWVHDELSFENFQKNRNELYAVTMRDSREQDTRESTSFVTSYALAPLLKQEFPGITDFVRLQQRNNFESCMLKYGDKYFYEDGMLLADPSFFRMFTYRFIKGDPRTALEERNSIVITQKTAEKFFGSDEPIGKVLRFNNRQDLIVSGVVENPPYNSEMQFNVVMPIQILGNEQLNSWAWESSLYILVQNDKVIPQLKSKIVDIIQKNHPLPGVKITVDLQPLTRIHLYYGSGDIRLIYVFVSVAIFILLLACINYMNLSTARFSRRAKEVGLRKVLGALRGALVRQFLVESVSLSLISLLIAITLVEILLPFFNFITDKSLTLISSDNLLIICGLIALAAGIGALAGSYPAIFLSSFQPAAVIRGTGKNNLRGPRLRMVLVVTQFSIAIVMLIATIIVYNQYNYLVHKDLGYNKEQIVYLPISKEIKQKYESLKNVLLQETCIKNVTFASSLPYEIGNVNPIEWEGKQDNKMVLINFAIVDHDYLNTLRIKLIAGRDFSKNITADISNFIINKKAAQLMNLENPVGNKINFMGLSGKVIGIVDDFNNHPLNEKTTPLILFINPNYYDYFLKYALIKINSSNIPETLKYIENTFNESAPGYPLELNFLDRAVNNLYKSIHRSWYIFEFFAFLAIFISCLGLFGLASFMTELRTKEIGVRKTLGASVPGIILLLTKEFTKWVLYANIIAWPLAYYFMNKWLGDFAYKTEITFWIFLFAGSLTLIIALLTVSIHAIKAATANPVKSLKYE